MECARSTDAKKGRGFAYESPTPKVEENHRQNCSEERRNAVGPNGIQTRRPEKFRRQTLQPDDADRTLEFGSRAFANHKPVARLDHGLGCYRVAHFRAIDRRPRENSRAEQSETKDDQKESCAKWAFRGPLQSTLNPRFISDEEWTEPRTGLSRNAPSMGGIGFPALCDRSHRPGPDESSWPISYRKDVSSVTDLAEA